MKLNLKEIINIKNKKDLDKYVLNKPLFQKNYLFHYLILLDNIDGLKLTKFPIYIENIDYLNGFHLASKENKIEILCYLIENYNEYIYNRNSLNYTFTHYLEPNYFLLLIKKYRNLDWDDLILNGSNNTMDILSKIIVNLNFNDLTEFLNLYNNYNSIFYICNNNLITTDQKILLYNKYEDDILNKKNELNIGLLLYVINDNNKKLFDYLVNRNIDLNYYSYQNTENPLVLGIYNDIMNNDYYYVKKMLKIIYQENKNYHYITDKYNNNIGHHLLYIRINRLTQQILLDNINTKPDIEILKTLDSISWNHKNINKETPLDLIMNLDYEIYHTIFNNNIIEIDSSILKNKNKWTELFKTFPKYNDINNVKINEYKYAHSTLFQASLNDVILYFIYLSKKYKKLLIPITKNYLLNNVTSQISMEQNDLLLFENIFPFIILYYDDEKYNIHPYLNNIINSAKKNNKYDYGIVFLSIKNNDTLHANILIYDFNNLIIERFEPYGSNYNNKLDNLLEEELTWNTGFKYIKPSEYLPLSGFQTISDENNEKYIKHGDFGGFCLAWCLWYIETKILNKNIKSNILVNKLINKINKLDITFVEYIRNYSNFINKKRIKYLNKMGIDIKETTNMFMSIDNTIKINNYLIKKFKY
jgi:hypothetical protein